MSIEEYTVYNQPLWPKMTVTTRPVWHPMGPKLDEMASLRLQLLPQWRYRAESIDALIYA